MSNTPVIERPTQDNVSIGDLLVGQVTMGYGCIVAPITEMKEDMLIATYHTPEGKHSYGQPYESAIVLCMTLPLRYLIGKNAAPYLENLI